MIIFLDFDGVLHPLDGDPAALFCSAPHLWSILRKHPETQVVFSTAWRSHLPLRTLIDYTVLGGGEDLADRFIDSIPVLPLRAHGRETGHRLREARAWLAANSVRKLPWLALDDVPELWSNSPNLYSVDQRHGLRAQDVEAIAMKVRSIKP